MHIDLNSCFAMVEQQANPLLRNKPVAVAAYATSSGCILAASYEAKRLGVKTGMRVKEGRLLCPSLIVLPPDAPKYRDVHLKLRKVLSSYTNDFVPRSIDEFVLNLKDYPVSAKGMTNIGLEIKKRIKKEVGDYLTVSVGISTNRFLAKTACSLHKPDGLEEINKDNFESVFSKLNLVDLCGIKARNASRLMGMGIYSVSQFYDSPIWKLKAAFSSIAGYYWWVRLHGFEIDDVEWGRRSYGNSYSLPKPFKSPKDLSPILAKLSEKTGFRLRKAGYKVQGVHLALLFKDHTYWHKGLKLPHPIFDSRDIFKTAFRLMCKSPLPKPVANIAVSCFNLTKKDTLQLNLFENIEKKKELVSAVDNINKRWGHFVVAQGGMLETSDYVPDRIAFGGVKELEEITTD
ncbi:MAG TPA: DNA polymerase IV [Patescibacteria group bacterium]